MAFTKDLTNHHIPVVAGLEAISEALAERGSVVIPPRDPEQNKIAKDFYKAIHNGNPPQDFIKKLLARVDASDAHNTCGVFHNVVTVETDNVVSRLRHRATMLRYRADELDHEADELETLRRLSIDGNGRLLQNIEEAHDVLSALAHIEPKQHR